ncbi:MAG: hypothetical protein H8D70_03070 [Rhodospirillaceae bacterium]|nr:hypothetical protein [Rhodospirillaceae bacterium]
MTRNNPCQVILVPGADSLTFEEDREEAARRGIPVRELTLPPFSGHRIDDRQAHFDAAAEIVAQAIEDIRGSEPDTRIAAIGRNNGGGQLAWAAAQGLTLDAIVLVGAIPEISRYRRESTAPSAVNFRASLESESELTRIDGMTPLDIVSSSKHWVKTPCLSQFGRSDPYIDETATEAAETLAKQFRVEWLDDDHAMVSPTALAQRWDFIESIVISL